MAAAFASEAAWALFSYLFSVRGARRLYAYVENHNGASRRLCERLGMRQERLFLEYVSFKKDDSGEPIFENTMQFAILRRNGFKAVSGSPLQDHAPRNKPA